METWPGHILYAAMRWIHIVSTTLIVGGTLFFEFVVPLATESLKREQQLDVFGKARWVFRQVVWVSSILLLLSGAVSLVRMWDTYTAEQYRASLPWAIGHAALAVVGMGIAIVLSSNPRPPAHHVGWMRFNLAVLLIVIFGANVSRHIRITVREREAAMGREAFDRLRQPIPYATPDYSPATAPTTQP